jgi:subtilisin-like proprotein convertase family protein
MKSLFAILVTVVGSVAFAAPLDRDRYQLSDRGRSRLFEIAKDELHVARHVERIASLANAEAVRQHAAARQRATGNEYELVLYEVGQPRNEFTRRLLTKLVAVRLAPGSDHQALAASVGARSRGETSYAPGWFLFETGETGGTLALEAALRGRPGVLSVEPQLARQAQKKLIPNDTYFTQQWHLLNTGQNGGTAGVDINVTNVWNTYKGEGVKLAIVDDGLQWTHPDLTNHYNAALSWDFNDNDANPLPNPANGDDHGTACAGVAAAHGSNSVGVCGAAFNATLVGLRLIALPNTDADEAAAIAHSNAVIHVKSNSWGMPDGAQVVDGPGPLAIAALAQGAAQGRNGKGVIYLFAGGNGRASGEDVNYDGYPNSIYVTAIGAITDTNTQASYSEPGACLIVCAPSGGGRQDITTTDLLGNDGYNAPGATGELADRDYTKTFSGTSSACPLAAGVCALILQANPNLGWRDMQEILIRSATKNAASDTDWTTNSAGFHFNHKYGAGLINAKAAVTLATNNWQNLSPQVHISSAQTNLSVAIPDNNSNGVTRTFNMTLFPALRVEHVTVTVNILHPYRGDLAITLTSPNGMASRLAERHTDGNDNYASWTFSSVRHWGESSSGNWTVKIADLAALDTGTVTSVRLDIYGTTTNAHLIITNATPTVTLGNANGELDPGETISETVILQNIGATTATNITATLSTCTPGVTVLQANSTYINLASGTAASNLTAYAYRLAKTVPAGTTLNFIHVATANGLTFTNTFTHLTGHTTPLYVTNTFISSGSKAIPDLTTTYYTNDFIPLPAGSYIDNVTVAIRLNHTYDSDLQIAVRHPDGTEIMLSDKNGGSGDNYGNGSTPTTFDDSAASIISAGTPPYDGTYRPENPLAACRT